MMKRIAIVGSRDYPRLDLVRDFVGKLSDMVIVSGGALGVDITAERAAIARGLEVKIYKPSWNVHGKRAGAVRNQQIVDDSDEVVAFWDERSRGTLITIKMAKAQNKPLCVFGSNRQICIASNYQFKGLSGFDQ